MAKALVDTASILQERRDIDYSQRILELEPNSAPLVVLTGKLGKASVSTAEFRWFEHERNVRSITYTAATEAGTHPTNIQVDDSSKVRIGELLVSSKTTEHMIVTGITDATHIDVTRAYGTTAAANLTQNEPLYIIGNANAENSLPLAPKVGQPVRKTNYTQIIKNPVSMSNTSAAEKNRANPQERMRLQAQAALEHALDIEFVLLHGEPKEDLTTADGPTRTSGGVLYWAVDNAFDVGTSNGGTLTYAGMEEWLEQVFSYGSDDKWLMASSRLISVLDILAAGTLRTRPGDETYGIAVKEWVSSHGRLNIVKHRLLQGSEWGNMGVAIDFQTDELNYVYLDGRDTKLQLNIGDPGRDGYLDQYITECGLRFPQSKRHATITGVQAAG